MQVWLDRPKEKKKHKPTPSVWWSRWLNNSGNTFICQKKKKELLCSLQGDVCAHPRLCGPLKRLHLREGKAGWIYHWNETRVSCHHSSFTSSRGAPSRRVCLLYEAFRPGVLRLTGQIVLRSQVLICARRKKSPFSCCSPSDKQSWLEAFVFAEISVRHGKCALFSL